MKKLILILMVLTFCLVKAQTVTIGSQVWTTKNLNVDKFRNGETIPQAKTNAEWQAAGKNKQPAWCYYKNDPANGAKYGKLYNWYAVIDAQGLAPKGFHVPSDAEWTMLTDYLGGEGTKMKSKSGWKGLTYGGSKTCPNCEDWSAEYRKKVPCHTCKDTRIVAAPTKTTNGNGTNSSGFSGLPGGFRYDESSTATAAYVGDTFILVGYGGGWWSSTEDNYFLADNGWTRSLLYDYGNVSRSSYFKKGGFSVRCLEGYDDNVRVKAQNSVRIGELEIMKNDLGVMNWEDAKTKCAELGHGWRLPTNSELGILYELKEGIGGFANDHYWSSGEQNDYVAWIHDFLNDKKHSDYKNSNHYVRAVRDSIDQSQMEKREREFIQQWKH